MKLKLFLSGLFVTLLLSACGGGGSSQSGPKVERMTLVCDASFENIMSQEIDVFEYSYNNKRRQAWVIPYYVSQREAIDSLMDPDNSVRTIVTARRLTKQEKARLHNRKLKPREQRIAVDAIALIVNEKNPQDVISLKELRQILSGEIKTWDEMWPTKLDTIRVVFDQNGSSIMQFMRDSICGGVRFGSNVYAEQSARDVFDAVTSRPNALGIVGVSWVSADMDGTVISKEEMRARSTANDTRMMRLTSQADDISSMCLRLREEYHPLLHGKRFITDAMLSELLGVSRRTTQDYRDRGLIPYYRLDGKILYAEEDIEAILQSNYRPKFD